jgi:hypothetical protein
LLGAELTHELLECHFSCFASGRHGLKKVWRLSYGIRSAGAINLPPPRVWRVRPILYDNGIISLIELKLIHARLIRSMTTEHNHHQQIPRKPLNSETKDNCLIPYSACYGKSGAIGAYGRLIHLNHFTTGLHGSTGQKRVGTSDVRVRIGCLLFGNHTPHFAWA